jgi:hypothetical protein
MSVFLWILQIVLFLAFGAAAVNKLLQPREKLAGQMAWVENFTSSNVKVIAGLELLGAIGLVLPWWTGIARVLTPLAALGLVALMIGAAVVHLRLKEFTHIGVTVILAALSLVVAIGRFADL